MMTVDEEVMGLLRRLAGALERGVEVLEAMEGRYQRMDKWERDYQKMDKQEWDEKAEESEEDEEEDKEGKVEEVTRAETEMGMEIARRERRKEQMRRWGRQ